MGISPYNVSNANMSDSQAAALRSHMIACEVLNVFILCGTIWTLVCALMYGNYTQKWNKKSRNTIYIACCVAILLSVPDAIVILILYSVSESPSQYQCEIVMDLATAMSSLGLLGTYVFLWLRQRAIYNNKYMRVMHGRWMHVISWLLLILIVVCLISVACVSIVERSIVATDLGCMLQHHEVQGNSSVNWEALRIMELCATTLCQIGFLILFLYPMVQNRKMIKKVCAKQKRRRDRVDRVIRRCTVCAAIVIFSDIATEIWMQLIPPYYPVMVLGTINGLDLFVDVICIVATFDDFTVILTTPFRQKSNIVMNRPTQSKFESHDSEKSSRGNDVTKSTRQMSLTSTKLTDATVRLVKPG